MKEHFEEQKKERSEDCKDNQKRGLKHGFAFTIGGVVLANS